MTEILQNNDLDLTNQEKFAVLIRLISDLLMIDDEKTKRIIRSNFGNLSMEMAKEEKQNSSDDYKNKIEFLEKENERLRSNASDISFTTANDPSLEQLSVDLEFDEDGHKRYDNARIALKVNGIVRGNIYPKTSYGATLTDKVMVLSRLMDDLNSNNLNLKFDMGSLPVIED